MKKCDYCGTENRDEAKECKNCGLELAQIFEEEKSVEDKSRRPKLIILVATLLIITISAYYFIGTENEEVLEPQILLEKVDIDEIKTDWLDNSSWQVSATVQFKISNSNYFDLDLIRIDYSIFLVEDDGTFRIYDGTSSGGIISAKGVIQLNENFWFLSSTEGAENLKNIEPKFQAQGVAEFRTRTPSSAKITTQFSSND